MQIIPFFKFVTIAFSLNFLLFFIFKYFKLYDYPSPDKPHKKKTLISGGLGVFIFLNYICYSSFFEDSRIVLGFYLSFFFFIIGLIDDKFNIKPLTKLFLTVLALLIIFNNNEILKINFIGDYFFIGKIVTGKFAIIFSILGFLFLINSYNYSDGIDSNCILLFLNSTILLYIFYISVGHQTNSFDIFLKNFTIFSAVTSLAFCTFNLNLLGNNFKIFLGDNGSLLLGYINATTLVFLSENKILNPNLLIWANALIVYDFISVTIIRYSEDKNIFTKDTNHIHLIILKRTGNIFTTLLIINIINLLLGLSGLLIFKIYGQLSSLIFFIFFFYIYFFFHKKLIMKNNSN